MPGVVPGVGGCPEREPAVRVQRLKGGSRTTGSSCSGSPVCVVCWWGCVRFDSVNGEHPRLNKPSVEFTSMVAVVVGGWWGEPIRHHLVVGTVRSKRRERRL